MYMLGIYNNIPDITCYYDIDTKLDQNHSLNDDTLKITRSVKLYNDRKLTKLVGGFVAENIECSITKILKMDNTFIFYDIPGGFSSSHISNINNTTDTVLNSSKETIFDIYTGSGEFLNKRGIMMIITDNTNIRTVKIYLDTHLKTRYKKTKKNKKHI